MNVEKVFLIFGLVFLCSGCVSRYFNGYIPFKEENLKVTDYSIEGSFLNSKKYSYFNNIEGQNGIFIEVNNYEQPVVQVSIVLEEGSEFRFSDPNVLIQYVDGSEPEIIKMGLIEWPTGNRYFRTTDMLKGKAVEIGYGYNTFITTLTPNHLYEKDCFILALPEFILNGSRITLPPILFQRFDEAANHVASCH